MLRVRKIGALPTGTAAAPFTTAINGIEVTLATSGLGGVLIKSMELTPGKGDIRWVEQLQNEFYKQYILRFRALAAAAGKCNGLAYSNTGSHGLRGNPNSQGRRFKVAGLHYDSLEADVAQYLRGNGWAANEWLDQL